MADFYRHKLIRGGPAVGLKIWHGPPVDPVTHETLTERSSLWRCEINGEEADIYQVAPWIVDGTGTEMRGDRITEEDYLLMAATAKWAAQYAPDDPLANPRQKVDLS